MHVGYVVVHGEDGFEVVLVGEDVDHPGKKIRVKGTPFGFTGFFGVDGTEHSELGMVTLVVLDLVVRGQAEVDVPVPARDAERDALVQFGF